ncbi:MAG: hypothetical protein R3E44_00135 [Paracoccaceae bacterium]
MAKLIAVLNVIAWAGFWAFGYIALTSAGEGGASMTIAAILAFAGGAAGIVAYLWLARHAEATGFARPANQAPREHHREPEGEA